MEPVTPELVEKFVNYVRDAMVAHPGSKCQLHMSRNTLPSQQKDTDGFVIGRVLTFTLIVENPS